MTKALLAVVVALALAAAPAHAAKTCGYTAGGEQEGWRIAAGTKTTCALALSASRAIGRLTDTLYIGRIYPIRAWSVARHRKVPMRCRVRADAIRCYGRGVFVGLYAPAG